VKCRHCQAQLKLTMVDLGSAPPSNSYLTTDTLKAPEKWFPLKILVCESCWLVQTEDFAAADELFSDEYAYFSSYSSSWLAHADRYVARMVARFGLNGASHVVEVAANDGYLLQYVQARGIRCTGIEPTASTAGAARQKGIDIVQKFFGTRLAGEFRSAGLQADLAVANNVLAHVPDINDFVAGFRVLLKPQGIVTFEFPHLLRLVAENQFDTIYHEHFSYLSLTSVRKILESHAMTVFDVEELDTHGGSLRVYAQPSLTGAQPMVESVARMLAEESAAGLRSPGFYSAFQLRAEASKDEFLRFLLDAKQSGKRVAAYGAAAKGNTLMNYAGVRPDLLAYIADRNPAKQGKFAPGSRIPIVEEDVLRQGKPDYVVILPWNLRKEIALQLDYVTQWGGKLVTVMPRLEIW
jgi:2-polyprenyl-3-methyl-5-hydroxy-6-metoxy-1,4-benzoquinol methylase